MEKVEKGFLLVSSILAMNYGHKIKSESKVILLTITHLGGQILRLISQKATEALMLRWCVNHASRFLLSQADLTTVEYLWV